MLFGGSLISFIMCQKVVFLAVLDIYKCIRCCVKMRISDFIFCGMLFCDDYMIVGYCLKCIFPILILLIHAVLCYGTCSYQFGLHVRLYCLCVYIQYEIYISYICLSQPRSLFLALDVE